MKIGFKKFWKGGILSWLIALVSWSRYSHTVMFIDEFVFEVLPNKGVIFYKVDEDLDYSIYDLVDIEVSEERKQFVLDDIPNYVGLKYDYIGALLSWTIGRDDNSRWYCSELHCDILGLDSKSTPKHLYTFLRIGNGKI